MKLDPSIDDLHINAPIQIQPNPSLMFDSRVEKKWIGALCRVVWLYRNSTQNKNVVIAHPVHAKAGKNLRLHKRYVILLTEEEFREMYIAQELQL